MVARAPQYLHNSRSDFKQRKSVLSASGESMEQWRVAAWRRWRNSGIECRKISGKAEENDSGACRVITGEKKKVSADMNALNAVRGSRRGAASGKPGQHRRKDERSSGICSQRRARLFMVLPLSAALLFRVRAATCAARRQMSRNAHGAA